MRRCVSDDVYVPLYPKRYSVVLLPADYMLISVLLKLALHLLFALIYFSQFTGQQILWGLGVFPETVLELCQGTFLSFLSAAYTI